MAKNMLNKIISMFFILLIFSSVACNIFAVQVTDVKVNESDGKNFLEEIFNVGNKFGQIGTTSDDKNTPAVTLQKSVGELINKFVNIIFYIGNIVFLAATIMLGVKYLLQSSQGKADIKGSMANLLVGAVFFYSGKVIFELVNGAFTQLLGPTNTGNAFVDAFATFVPIAQMLAYGAIIFIGLKYMFSDSKGKAKIKQQIIPIMVGIMLVFSTTTILNFVIKQSADVLK